MFRMTRFFNDIYKRNPATPQTLPTGPVVIWNLIRRCNLTCKHCYSISTDKDFPGELSTHEVYRVMDDLKDYGVPVLILSGGEPLLRDDIYSISARAKSMGFYVGLSTNGTLIDETNIQKIADANFNYVGISIDGLEERHDKFRRKPGAFKESMKAVELCKQHGIKVGLRFTLTQDNASDLEAVLDLLDEHNIDKFYLSHLNYAGRGNKNRKDDAVHQMTRDAMNLLFDRCWDSVIHNRNKEFVTGNNDADGIFLLQWAQKNAPEYVPTLQKKLEQWGGNASGKYIANIDNLGNVHPDTFWWNYNLGNVKQRNFSEIWEDISDPLMAGLKQSPRPVEGRCGQCQYLAICGGNTRVRAYQLTGDFWQEDPACYLDDDTLGITATTARLSNRPYDGRLRSIPVAEFKL